MIDFLAIYEMALNCTLNDVKIYYTSLCNYFTETKLERVGVTFRIMY